MLGLDRHASLTDTRPRGAQTMIWLSIVSLTAGALLAQRFKIIVLVPATLMVALLAVYVEILPVQAVRQWLWRNCGRRRRAATVGRPSNAGR